VQIELDEKTQSALEKAAAAAGVSASQYVSRLMQEQMVRGSRTAEARMQAIDRMLGEIRRGSTSSGRAGRRWREFIHEGHPE